MKMSRPLVLHCGESMLPVLRDGDLLETAPPSRPLEAGDVIMFRTGEKGDRVVHRITSLLPEGIRTRGDNSDCPDSWVLPATGTVALVRARIRDGNRRLLRRGRAGRVEAVYARCRRRVLAALSQSRLLGILDGMAEYGSRLLPLPRLRVLAFTSEGGDCRKLLLGGKVIGRYDEARKKWLVRRRYRWLASSRITRKSSEI